MAEPTLTFVLEAQDRVTAQLQKVEQSLEKLNNKANATKKGTDDLGKSTVTLNGLYGGLMKTLALVGGTVAVTNFLKDSTEAANEDSKALILLSARLRSVGMNYGENEGKISAYTDKMIKVGIAESVTNDGLGKFVAKTKDMQQAMELSTLAADLAASGQGTYADNVDNLTKILSGRGAMAMKAYNIKMDESATTAEQLAAVQGKVTITAAEMAETTVGKLQVMNTNWGEFKGNLGKVGLFFEGELATYVNNFFEETGITSELWLKKISTAIYATALQLKTAPTIVAQSVGSTIEGASDWWGTTVRGTMDKMSNFLYGGNLKEEPTVNDNLIQLGNTMADTDKKVDEFYQSLDKIFKKIDDPIGGNAKKKVEALSGEFEDLSGASEAAAEKSAAAWEKAAGKMKSDFTSFSNKLLGEVDKQKDAILKLKETMMSAQEKYNAEVERIGSNKDYQGVENSAAKDAALATAQNELDMQIEAYKSQEEAAKKNLLITAIKASDPNLMSKVSKESDTFLYGIGQSAIQQQFTFNFNGDVNDIEKLKQLIIAALDRQASLAKVQ